jgi:hypothetical protein
MDDCFATANAAGMSVRVGYKGSKDSTHRVRWVTPIKQYGDTWLCYDLTRRGMRKFRTDRTAADEHVGSVFAPVTFPKPGNGYTEDSLPGYTEAAELGLIPA